MSEIFNQNWTRERVRAGMRWFGPQDIVTIRNIRQTPGITNVISALHHIPAGEVWTEAEVAKAAGVRLCCHSDDPAFTPFLGTPRSVGSSEGYKFLLDHGCGANFCIGSLMANEKNRDITIVIREIAEYGIAKGMSLEEIFPHIHLRPIETDGKNFREGHHAEHREELAKVVHTLVDLGWQGVFRPDHAPSSDHGIVRPGYDVIGRGYGANLILGLFEMAEILKTTRFRVVEAAIKASGGNMSLKEEAVQAARAAECDKIGRKISFIKIPFAYGEQGICAFLK